MGTVQDLSYHQSTEICYWAETSVVPEQHLAASKGLQCEEEEEKEGRKKRRGRKGKEEEKEEEEK